MKLIEKVRATAARLKTMGRRPPRKMPPQRLQARVRAAVAATADAYDDEEPQTKLTSAFVVVLILHVVAVGGIYAFNQIKASRRTLETGSPSASQQVGPKTTVSQDSIENPANQPLATNLAAASPATSAPASTLSGPARQRVHNVKSGETLTSIARQYNTTVADLKAFNSLPNDGIKPGQILNIPAPGIKPVAETTAPKKSDATPESKPATRNHIVKSGDRVIFIAKKYNVQPEEIIAFNKNLDPTKLVPGQILKIPPKK